MFHNYLADLPYVLKYIVCKALITHNFHPLEVVSRGNRSLYKDSKKWKDM